MKKVNPVILYKIRGGVFVRGVKRKMRERGSVHGSVKLTQYFM